MIINLINGYYIKTEPMNYTLFQDYTFTDKEGNEKQRTRTCGYYRDLTQAMEYFLKYHQGDLTRDVVVKFDELVKTIEAINQNAISRLCAVIKKQHPGA